MLGSILESSYVRSRPGGMTFCNCSVEGLGFRIMGVHWESLFSMVKDIGRSNL